MIGRLQLKFCIFPQLGFTIIPQTLAVGGHGLTGIDFPHDLKQPLQLVPPLNNEHHCPGKTAHLREEEDAAILQQGTEEGVARLHIHLSSSPGKSSHFRYDLPQLRHH